MSNNKETKTPKIPTNFNLDSCLKTIGVCGAVTIGGVGVSRLGGSTTTINQDFSGIERSKVKETQKEESQLPPQPQQNIEQMVADAVSDHINRWSRESQQVGGATKELFTEINNQLEYLSKNDVAYQKLLGEWEVWQTKFKNLETKYTKDAESLRKVRDTAKESAEDSIKKVVEIVLQTENELNNVKNLIPTLLDNNDKTTKKLEALKPLAEKLDNHITWIKGELKRTADNFRGFAAVIKKLQSDVQVSLAEAKKAVAIAEAVGKRIDERHEADINKEKELEGIASAAQTRSLKNENSIDEMTDDIENNELEIKKIQGEQQKDKAKLHQVNVLSNENKSRSEHNKKVNDRQQKQINENSEDLKALGDHYMQNMANLKEELGNMRQIMDYLIQRNHFLEGLVARNSLDPRWVKTINDGLNGVKDQLSKSSTQLNGRMDLLNGVVRTQLDNMFTRITATESIAWNTNRGLNNVKDSLQFYIMSLARCVKYGESVNFKGRDIEISNIQIEKPGVVNYEFRS